MLSPLALEAVEPRYLPLPTSSCFQALELLLLHSSVPAQTSETLGAPLNLTCRPLVSTLVVCASDLHRLSGSAFPPLLLDVWKFFFHILYLYTFFLTRWWCPTQPSPSSDLLSVFNFRLLHSPKSADYLKMIIVISLRLLIQCQAVCSYSLFLFMRTQGEGCT